MSSGPSFPMIGILGIILVLGILGAIIYAVTKGSGKGPGDE